MTSKVKHRHVLRQAFLQDAEQLEKLLTTQIVNEEKRRSFLVVVGTQQKKYDVLNGKIFEKTLGVATPV